MRDVLNAKGSDSVERSSKKELRRNECNAVWMADLDGPQRLPPSFISKKGKVGLSDATMLDNLMMGG